MPVVELSYERLAWLVSRGSSSSSSTRVSRDEISEKLPYLGLDIESDDGDAVRIEYSPNRPDYATDVGVSLALQGLLGVSKGLVPLDAGPAPSGPDRIVTRRAVAGVRPVITGIMARGGALDDHMLRQLVALQEDLHLGLGRGRRKVAIGLHDASKISGGFPLTYTAVPSNHRFVPLNETKEMTVSQIIKGTKAGRAYSHLVAGHERFPVILDGGGNTVSLPPIINSAMTAVTTDTTDIFVDVTGVSRHAAEDALAVVAVTLRAAGFSLGRIGIGGSRNRTPPLETRTIPVSVGRANEMLGLGLSVSDAASCLERCRLQPVPQDGGGGSGGGGQNGVDGVIPCLVPPYRPDIVSEVDLVEEIALGYGTWRIRPVLSPSKTFGAYDAASVTYDAIDMVMVGMGYVEALNPGLSNARILYEMADRPTPTRSRMISAVDSKSREHSVLRDSILPGLVENLSRNIHEEYPQKLYETGTVFLKAGRREAGSGKRPADASPVSERMHVAAIAAHAGSGFSEAKSVLQTALGAVISDASEIRTAPALHHMFADGRCAKVSVIAPRAAGDNRARGRRRRVIGYAGEIDPAILSAYRIRVPAAGFEVSLPGLPPAAA